MHSQSPTQLSPFVAWTYSYKCIFIVKKNNHYCLMYSSYFHKIQDFFFCSVSILSVMEASCIHFPLMMKFWQPTATLSPLSVSSCTSVMGALVRKGNALSWRPHQHQSGLSGSIPVTGAATVCLLFRENTGADRPQAISPLKLSATPLKSFNYLLVINI